MPALDGVGRPPCPGRSSAAPARSGRTTPPRAAPRRRPRRRGRDRRPGRRRPPGAGAPSRPSAGSRCRSRGPRSPARRGSARGPRSQRPLGGGDAAALDAGPRRAGPGHALEGRLQDVVGVLARAQADVEGQPGRRGEGPPELLGQLGVERRRAERAWCPGRIDLVGEEGRPDRSRATSTSASSRGTATEPNRRMPALSPSAAARHLSEGDADVLDGVVGVDLEVAAGRRPRDRIRACRPSWLTMWSKKGRPVETSVDPGAVEVHDHVDRRLLGGPVGRSAGRCGVGCRWSWRSSQAFGQCGQEAVVLLGEPHRDPEAPGEARPLRTVSHEDRRVEEIRPHRPPHPWPSAGTG